MRGSPTSRGTPASVRRSGSLPLRRRAAAPGKSTRPTPATCRPPALVCDCEYLITHDQRAWQEMTDGRGPPPKGKGTLEEKPRHSPSVGRERPLGSTAATESNRAEEDPGGLPSVGLADRRQRRCPRLETAGTTQPVKRTNLTKMLCLSGRVEPQRKLPLRAPRPPYRTLQGWALGTLIEQGYIISVSAKYSHFMDLFTFERFRSRRRRPPPLAQHLRAPGARLAVIALALKVTFGSSY